MTGAPPPQGGRRETQMVSMAPVGVGFVFALLAIVVAFLLALGVLPLTAPLVGGSLILLGVARLMA